MRRAWDLDGAMRSSMAPLLVAACYWIAAALSLALTRNIDGIATMWPASGVLLAGLLRLPARLVARCAAMAAVASLAANLQAGNAVAASLAFTTANMVEALVANALLRRWGVARPSFIALRDVRRFAAVAVGAAAVSAAIAWAATPGAGRLFALEWFATVALGLLIVAPTLLIVAALFDEDDGAALRPRSPLVAAALIAMIAAVTAAVFAQAIYPLLFLPLVALLAATYRLGPLGAAAGVTTIATVASLLTGLGLGPIAATSLDVAKITFFLQFYLLVSLATALPLGALLAEQRRLAALCSDSERAHRLLADSSTDIIIRFSLAGVARYCSPAIEAVLGMTAEDAIGGSPIGRIHPDDRAAVAAIWARVVAGEPGETAIFRQRRRDDSYAWLEVAYRRVDTADGPEIIASARDITARRAAEIAAERAGRQMREANRLLGMAERAAQVGHWRLDFAGDSLFWSPEVFRIHGVTDFAQPALAAAIDFYHPDDRDRVAALVAGSLDTGTGFEFEARIMRADGAVRHVVSRGQPEFGYDGEATGLFGVIQDITRQVLAEAELEAARAAAERAAAQAIRMADTDALTGVASRRRSLAALDEAILEARAADAPLALAIFDIDHFKAVNDRFGHPAGDAVLRRVARAAQEAVRPTDLVGRLGGEEFMVLLPGVGAGNAVALADTLRRAIAASADGVGAGPPVTASIGVALLVPDGSAASLLGEADRALYRAKESGRNAARLAA